MNKTKIVASLGPASNDLEIIEQMINGGVDVFRINMSHASIEETEDLIKKIRKIEKKLNKIVGIMLDTDGPSIRLDKFKEEEVFLKLDKEIRIYNYHVVCNNTQFSTNYDKITNLVTIGEEIKLSNGNVLLEVIKINEDNFICKVKKEGIIKSGQTIHIQDGNYHLPFMSLKDKENIMCAIKNDVDFLALSYVRDEQDILEVIDMLIENENEHMNIIAKIENERAFNNLDEILKVVDGVMVARGDLGIEIPLEKLPFHQKQIIALANKYQKISLVATDLLKSMVLENNPSRAEVADIYNAVFDKCDALVLCDETTIGVDPVNCIEVIKKVVTEAENDFPYKENLDETFKLVSQDVTSTIAYSVVNADLILNAKGILANTMSGYTARKISYFRPKSIIIGLSPKLSTLRSLTLNYGVLPILVNKFTDTDSIIDESIKEYKKVIPSQENDIVILTGGFPLDNKSTNFMKIEKL